MIWSDVFSSGIRSMSQRTGREFGGAFDYDSEAHSPRSAAAVPVRAKQLSTLKIIYVLRYHNYQKERVLWRPHLISACG